MDLMEKWTVGARREEFLSRHFGLISEEQSLGWFFFFSLPENEAVITQWDRQVIMLPDESDDLN